MDRTLCLILLLASCAVAEAGKSRNASPSGTWACERMSIGPRQGEWDDMADHLNRLVYPGGIFVYAHNNRLHFNSATVYCWDAKQYRGSLVKEEARFE